jgi:hypothetical protein
MVMQVPASSEKYLHQQMTGGDQSIMKVVTWNKEKGDWRQVDVKSTSVTGSILGTDSKL